MTMTFNVVNIGVKAEYVYNLKHCKAWILLLGLVVKGIHSTVNLLSVNVTNDS